MGVDNSGIIMIGAKEEDIVFEESEIYQEFLLDEDADDDFIEWLYWLSKPVGARLSWTWGVPRGYTRSEYFGFYLSSPSYGDVEFSLADFQNDLEVLPTLFRQQFKIEPQIILMNMQG